MKQAEIDVGASHDNLNGIDEPELLEGSNLPQVHKPSRKEMLSSEA